MAENVTQAPIDSVAVTVLEEKSDKNSKKEKKSTKKSFVAKPKPIPIKYLILSSTIFSFLLSLPILASIIWLLYTREYDCESLLRLRPLEIFIIIGLIIVLVINNVVVYFRAKFPVPGLLLIMVPLILMFMVGLGLIGALKGESRRIVGSPSWLKRRIDDDSNWSNIKSCIYDTGTCNDLFSRSYLLKAYDFNRLKLSYIERGCCRPPVNCNMEYVNGTYWKKDSDPIQSSATYDIDCDLWINEGDKLCYKCYSCEDGFWRTIKGKWWSLGSFLVAMSVLLTISHLLLFVSTMWEHHVGA